MQALQGASLEERVAHLQDLEKHADPADLADFRAKFDMSWIYHDSALEGVVYTMDELRAAIEDGVVSDTTLLPVYDEIRHNLAAVHMVRELAAKRRMTISLPLIKNIYATLAPEEVEGKSPPKYRKEMPLHRLYFHDLAPPDKVSYRMRQLVSWMTSTDTKRSTHPVRLASKAHYEFLQIHPFARHSGKLARLLMNLILLRHGYPPAIIHATERQRYYEALKVSDDRTSLLINEALTTSVESTIRYLETVSRVA
ncbi:MAG: cell filamentation protein Fic [Deltaproteobacteria bacterium]|nr:cell filamentation protein Fic [Deltaproteobacteria bacterium]